jgi:transglutaminase-like putative cysteine protease
MLLSISHRTTYQYTAPVTFSDHLLLLRPRESQLLDVRRFAVQTTPVSRQRWMRDVFNNLVLVCHFGLERSATLAFDCSMELRSEEQNPFDFVLEPYATAFPIAYREPDRRALEPYITTPVADSLKVLDWFYHAVPNPNRHPDVVMFLSDLCHAIRNTIQYQRRDEEGVQSPATTLRLGSGSCRDMALLFIAICRQLGMASRFVSGYLLDEPTHDGNPAHAFNRAAGSMHAWAEVYLPGAGWKGFDPTNGLLANAAFIPSAVSIDPAAASPVHGRFFSAEPVESSMQVELQVVERPQAVGSTPDADACQVPTAPFTGHH